MNRQNNVPISPSAALGAAAPLHKQQLPGRVSRGFLEAMKHISVKLAENSSTTSGAAATSARKRAAQPSAGTWRSSFKPIQQDDSSLNKSTSSPQRVELYNPYNPDLPDSEYEVSRGPDHIRSPPGQDNNLGRQHLSSSEYCCSKGRWDSPFPKTRRHAMDSHDFDPETRPGLSPGHRLPDRRTVTEPLDPLGYGSRSRSLDHRVCSPDMLIHSSPTQQFSASYGGQRTNGEGRMIDVEYRREVTTAVRLSPARLQRDYQQQFRYVETTGLDQITPSTDETTNRSKNIIMDKSPISCDLCDVELANAQELKDHLESKSHWDTLEHIQQHNNYDDLAIAFLQEVMLYKSLQCSRAIEDSALQALQENDHMTKIEIFHCAACKVFVSTSASSVQTHITSQEHLSSTKEFEVKQRRASLNKADTMMKGLKPQFEQFLKGGSPFE